MKTKPRALTLLFARHLAVLGILFVLQPKAVVSAALPAERGGALEQGKNDEPWQWLFSALAAKGATCSTFTEKRHFSTRKEPVVLAGEMRLAPERGLSLHYTAPDDALTLINPQGLYVRDAKGRERRIKAGTRDAGLTAALLPVMRFDQAELYKNFKVFAARNEDGWRFDFVPLDEKLAENLGSITASGAGTEIKQLSFNVSAKIRVEVFVGESKSGVTFTDDELKKFFP